MCSLCFPPCVRSLRACTLGHMHGQLKLLGVVALLWRHRPHAQVGLVVKLGVPTWPLQFRCLARTPSGDLCDGCGRCPCARHMPHAGSVHMQAICASIHVSTRVETCG